MSIHRSSLSIASLSVLTIAASSGASAQQFSATEREVWQFIEDCNQSYFEENEREVLNCYHEDFAGWAYDDAVPRTKDNVQKLLPVDLELYQPMAYDLRPITIRILGDIAVAHYALRWIQRNLDGEVETINMRWTDILQKENGRWSWVGDHGGVVEAGD